VGYFVFMAIAHFFSFKYPIVFIYYDTPFYAYQDKIISFCVVTYISLYLTAAFNRAVVPAALVSLGATVLGLSAINLSDDLAQVLEKGASTSAYWAQTAFIAVGWAAMLALYLTEKPRDAVKRR
jgi:hypothetical protein